VQLGQNNVLQGTATLVVQDALMGLRTTGRALRGARSSARDDGFTVGHPVCVQLAKALEDNTVLVTLDIGGNNIGPDGIAALAAALKGNETLKTLELGYNPIGPTGAEALCSVVKYDVKVVRRTPSTHGRG
jgi:ABC-type sugar transport system substrate-binding protein